MITLDMIPFTVSFLAHASGVKASNKGMQVVAMSRSMKTSTSQSFHRKETTKVSGELRCNDSSFTKLSHYIINDLLVKLSFMWTNDQTANILSKVFPVTIHCRRFSSRYSVMLN